MHYETEPYRSTTYGLLTLSGLVNGVLRILRSTTKDCNAPIVLIFFSAGGVNALIGVLLA